MINQDAIDALNSRISQTESLMAQLEGFVAMVKNMRDASPESINWAHVGDMAYIASELDDIAEFIESQE